MRAESEHFLGLWELLVGLGFARQLHSKAWGRKCVHLPLIN